MTIFYSCFFFVHILFCFLFQRDPEDHDVPYCTLKSFPAVIDHTIQWARNKVVKNSQRSLTWLDRLFGHALLCVFTDTKTLQIF